MIFKAAQLFILRYLACTFIIMGTHELIDIIKYPKLDMTYYKGGGTVHFNKKSAKEIVKVLREEKICNTVQDIQKFKGFLYKMFIKCVCGMVEENETNIKATHKTDTGVEITMFIADVKSRVATLKIGNSREFTMDYTDRDIRDIVKVYNEIILRDKLKEKNK